MSLKEEHLYLCVVKEAKIGFKKIAIIFAGRHPPRSRAADADPEEAAPTDGHHQRRGVHDPGHPGPRNPDLHRLRPDLSAAAHRRGLQTPHEAQPHRDAQGQRVQQLPVARSGEI